MMKEIEDFDNFKKAVQQNLEKEKHVILSRTAKLFLSPLIIGALSPSIITQFGIGKAATPSLNTLLFDEFLETYYREKFENQKDDISSVRMLISEATQLIKDIVYEKDN